MPVSATLLALGLRAAAAAMPATPATCPGPSLAAIEAEVGPADRFAFAGAMRLPFLQLWARGQHGSLPVEPDSITVLARPERPLVIVYARTGCALGLIEASRPEVFDALRAGIGPAV
ncbi:MAG: hypothetical protein U1E14_05575 [Geminicoccaceae bacterium]